jgi:hypothetical protein
MNGQTVRLTRAAKARRDRALPFIPGDADILEIGAFDSPTFIRDLGDRARYLDWFSSDELYSQHKDNPRRLVSNIVDVDYVIKSHRFADQISERFDLIAAAHVIEHVADVVSWLQQLQSLLTERGNIYLSIPDRRYTFDYYRRTSPLLDIIRAYEERLERPNKWQIADSIYHHVRVDLDALWAGQPPPSFQPRFGWQDTLARAERAARTYADVHCWVFTPESFGATMTGLWDCGLIDLRVQRLFPTARGANEFAAFLERA